MNTFTRFTLVALIFAFSTPFLSKANVNLVLFQPFALENGNVDIDWVTHGEVANSHFTLERSSNGNNFTPYAIVQGNGTTTDRNQYKVVDQNPFSGTTYYRLVQTDAFGQSDTLGVISVTQQFNLDFNQFNLMPNPVGGGSTLKVNGYSKDFLNQPVKIYNLASGQLVFESVVENEEAEFRLPENLSSGTYVIKMAGGNDQILSRTFIVK